MTATDAASSIISLLIDEVRQSLEPKILHILADYQTYKETHDAVLQIPFVKHLLENQCRCHVSSETAQRAQTPEAEQSINAPVNDEPIHLEIIEKHTHGLPNLDSISEYINSTIESSASASEADEEVEEAVSEAEEEAASEAEEEAASEAEEEAASEAEEEAVSEAEEAVSEAEEAVSEAEAEEEEEEKEEEEEEEEEEEVAQENAPEETDAASEAVSEAKEAVSEAKEAVSEAKEAVSEAEEEEELELFEVEIKGKTYVTNDEMQGDIYEYVNDEVGEIVGTFKNGVAKFAKKPKPAQKK